MVLEYLRIHEPRKQPEMYLVIVSAHVPPPERRAPCLLGTLLKKRVWSEYGLTLLTAVVAATEGQAFRHITFTCSSHKRPVAAETNDSDISRFRLLTYLAHRTPGGFDT